MGADVYKLLGFANRARKVVIGTTGVMVSLQRRRAKVLLVAADLSTGTREKVAREAATQRLPVLVHGTKRDLGHALGRDEVGVVGVLDVQFARAIAEALAVSNDDRSDAAE